MKKFWEAILKWWSSYQSDQKKPTPQPKPIDPPKPVDPVKPVEPTTDKDEFTIADIHTAPDVIKSWPIVSDLIVKQEGNKLHFNSTQSSHWPNIDGCCAHIHALLFRNGVWHCGPCDALHPMPSVKEASCICVPDGKKRLYTPEVGEKVGILITGFCRYGNDMKPAQRSSIAWITWKK